jgi:hypothetical protein
MRDLPPSIMFIIRAANLVGIHNAILGGNTRNRLKSFTDNALKRLYQHNNLLYYYHKAVLIMKLLIFEKA